MQQQEKTRTKKVFQCHPESYKTHTAIKKQSTSSKPSQHQNISPPTTFQHPNCSNGFITCCFVFYLLPAGHAAYALPPSAGLLHPAAFRQLGGAALHPAEARLLGQCGHGAAAQRVLGSAVDRPEGGDEPLQDVAVLSFRCGDRSIR